MPRYCLLDTSIPAASRSIARRTAPFGPSCWKRCETPAGATTRSSCATTACSSVTRKPTILPSRRNGSPDRGQCSLAGGHGGTVSE